MSDLRVQDLPPLFYLVNGSTSQLVMVDFGDLMPNSVHVRDYSIVHAKDEDSALWYSEDLGYSKDLRPNGIALRNRKSGLFLGRDQQLSPTMNQSNGAQPVGWGFEDLGNGTVRIRPLSGSVGSYPGGAVLSQDGHHQDNPMLNYLDLRAEQQQTALYYHWKIAPIGSLDPSYALTRRDRDKVAGGIEKGAALVADVLKLTGDITKAAASEKSEDKAAAIFYGASLVAKLVAGISGLVDYFSDEGDDPTQLLYQAMMPSIRSLVRKVDAAAVTQAAGYAAAARLEVMQVSDIVARTMTELDPSKKITDSDLRKLLGNDLDSVHESMINARQNFDRALGILQVDEDGFIPWVQVAQESVAFEILRFSIDPLGHGQEAYSHAKLIKGHATTTLIETKSARRARVKNGIDTFYSAQSKIPSGSEAAYLSHLDRIVDIALGGDAVTELSAACDQIMKTIPTVMKLQTQ